MTRRSLPVILCAGVIAILPLAATAAAQSTADEPELVMITLRPKPGAETALAEVIARHFDTARQLNMLAPDAPLRGAARADVLRRGVHVAKPLGSRSRSAGNSGDLE